MSSYIKLDTLNTAGYPGLETTDDYYYLDITKYVNSKKFKYVNSKKFSLYKKKVTIMK
jgi:hypothetical protein